MNDNRTAIAVGLALLVALIMLLFIFPFKDAKGESEQLQRIGAAVITGIILAAFYYTYTSSVDKFQRKYKRIYINKIVQTELAKDGDKQEQSDLNYFGGFTFKDF